MESVAPQRADVPQAGLGFFRYARNFTTGLLKDSRFWSRFNAIPNGIIFIAQGVGGAIFLAASAPLIAQVAGFAACAALAGIGLFGIGYGFPRAWQSMEALCARTFPKFNPPKKAREPMQAFARKIARLPFAQKILKSPLLRFRPRLKTEQQQDMFLAALTLEGASAAAVACSIAIAPHVLALPAITIAGGALMAGALWTISTCLFDIYSSGKTLIQAYRHHRQEKKLKDKAKTPTPSPAPAPVPQEARSGLQAPPMTPPFNNASANAPPVRPPLTPPHTWTITPPGGNPNR